jgi:hypothetical protein
MFSGGDGYCIGLWSNISLLKVDFTMHRTARKKLVGRLK